TIKISQFASVPLNAGDVLADFLHRFVQLILAAAGYEHVRTLLHKELGGCQCQAGGRSSNNGDFAFEFSHLLSPWFRLSLVFTAMFRLAIAAKASTKLIS